MHRLPAATGKYLKTRGCLYRILGIDDLDLSRLRTVVIVPAMAERETLPVVLASLRRCPGIDSETCLVAVIVNHPDRSPPRVCEENADTLEWLGKQGRGLVGRLVWLDAASPGRELPAGRGVGLARKIAADSLLDGILSRQPDRLAELLLVHLDADCTVAGNYLGCLDSLERDRSAFVLGFEHRLDDLKGDGRAILGYELFLRYLVEGMRRAGSPYAYHTIGSTIASTAETYIMAGGMPGQRTAGEDFYFLQECAKIGRVRTVPGPLVHPSARQSWRVPFGTGPAMQSRSGAADSPQMAPDPHAFLELGQALSAVSDAAAKRAETIVGALPAACREHFAACGADAVWRKLLNNCRDSRRLLAEFHRWFDALATIRLIRRRGEKDRPAVEVAQAWIMLADLLGGERPQSSELPGLLALARRCQNVADSRGIAQAVPAELH